MGGQSASVYAEDLPTATPPASMPSNPTNSNSPKLIIAPPAVNPATTPEEKAPPTSPPPSVASSPPATPIAAIPPTPPPGTSLASLPTLHLATTTWPPYVGEKMKGMGYITAIITTAFQRGGYGTSINFMPWIEAKNLTKYHNDAFYPAYAEDMNDTVICSMPFAGGPVGLYKRAGSVIHYKLAHPEDNQTAALEQLSMYRFGVVNGYTNTKDFDEATFLYKVPATNDFENLEQLHEGKVDLIFTDIFLAEYLIGKYPQFKDLEFMGPALENKKLYVCFDKTNPASESRLAAFNQQLQALKDSGEFVRIMNAFSF